MTPLTPDKALAKAAHLCAQGEKSPKEIFDKLITWGVSEPVAEEIVCRLREEKYIDEERYAHAFVHDKFVYEHWGKVKISYALRQKGISESLISNTLDDVISDEDYVQSLSDLLASRMRGMSLPLSVNDRAKLYRFAMQRGYDSQTFSSAVRGGGESSEDLEY